MLKNLILILVLFMVTAAQSQTLVDELKKKYFGVYMGEIPAYEYNAGATVVDVQSVSILIELDADHVILEIGQNKKTGSYQVLFKGEDYYVLDASFPDELQGERIVVHENKTLMREGTFPQPNAQLDKLKKREIRELERL